MTHTTCSVLVVGAGPGGYAGPPSGPVNSASKPSWSNQCNQVARGSTSVASPQKRSFTLLMSTPLSCAAPRIMVSWAFTPTTPGSTWRRRWHRRTGSFAVSPPASSAARATLASKYPASARTRERSRPAGRLATARPISAGAAGRGSSAPDPGSRRGPRLLPSRWPGALDRPSAPRSSRPCAASCARRSRCRCRPSAFREFRETEASSARTQVFRRLIRLS